MVGDDGIGRIEQAAFRAAHRVALVGQKMGRELATRQARRAIASRRSARRVSMLLNAAAAISPKLKPARDRQPGPSGRQFALDAERNQTRPPWAAALATTTVARRRKAAYPSASGLKR